jgi:hypothetical protein
MNRPPPRLAPPQAASPLIPHWFPPPPDNQVTAPSPLVTPAQPYTIDRRPIHLRFGPSSPNSAPAPRSFLALTLLRLPPATSLPISASPTGPPRCVNITSDGSEHGKGTGSTIRQASRLPGGSIIGLHGTKQPVAICSASGPNAGLLAPRGSMSAFPAAHDGTMLSRAVRWWCTSRADRRPAPTNRRLLEQSADRVIVAWRGCPFTARRSRTG